MELRGAVAEEARARRSAAAAAAGALRAAAASCTIGQGKWYPGEPLPRWALGVYWRTDGVPLWQRRRADRRHATARARRRRRRRATSAARSRSRWACRRRCVITAYEDVPRLLGDEAALPVNVDPLQPDLAQPGERARLARLLLRGLDQPGRLRAAAQGAPPDKDGDDGVVWETSPWPLRRERLYAVAGDSPLGLRLPLVVAARSCCPRKRNPSTPVDPFAPRDALPARATRRVGRGTSARRRAARSDQDRADRRRCATATCTSSCRRSSASRTTSTLLGAIEDTARAIARAGRHRRLRAAARSARCACSTSRPIPA